MESDLLNNLNLLFAFFLGGTVFFAFIGIVWRVQSEQMARTATEKSREVGADEETLNQLRRRKSILLRWSDQYDQGESADELRAQLSRANLKIKPSEYQTYRVIGMVVVAIVLYYFVSLNFGVALGVGLLLARFIPPWVLRARRQQYIDAFNNQLIEATSIMAGSIRAGMSPQQAFERVSQKMPSPASEEFQMLSRDVNWLGESIENSLQKAVRRLPSDDLNVVAATLIIQKQMGGNLVHALEQLSDIMRERAELHREIQTMTAEVRYSAYLIIGMPVLLVVMLRNLVPTIVEPLFTNPIGWVVMSVFFSLLIIAFVLIQRIANIKV